MSKNRRKQKERGGKASASGVNVRAVKASPADGAGAGARAAGKAYSADSLAKAPVGKAAVAAKTPADGGGGSDGSKVAPKRRAQILVFAAGVFLAAFGIFAGIRFFYAPADSPQIQFSSDRNKSRISRKCKKWIERLVSHNQPDSYVCRVRSRKRSKGASWTVISKIIIEREAEGGNITAKLVSEVKDPDRHATEADFCTEGCENSAAYTGQDTMEIIEKIADMVSTEEDKVKEAVEEAKAEYDRKKREERMGRLKEKNCRGKWHEEEKEFEEWDVLQQTDCKFTKLRSIEDPAKRELYYQNVLRRDLWNFAVNSEEGELLRESLLGASVDPQYSLSTRSSVNLLSQYLGWRENYSLLDSAEDRERFGYEIRREAEDFVSRLDQRYASGDLELLNAGMRKNFEEAFARIQSVPVPSSAVRSSSGGVSGPASLPAVDYNRAREGIQGL